MQNSNDIFHLCTKALYCTLLSPDVRWKMWNGAVTWSWAAVSPKGIHLNPDRHPCEVILLSLLHCSLSDACWVPTMCWALSLFSFLITHRTHSIPHGLKAPTFSSYSQCLASVPPTAVFVHFLLFYFWWKGEQLLTTHRIITLQRLRVGILGAAIFTF